MRWIVTKGGYSGEASPAPDQAAHPSRATAEAALAAAAFPPLEVAWVPLWMEWDAKEDMVCTFRA